MGPAGTAAEFDLYAIAKKLRAADLTEPIMPHGFVGTPARCFEETREDSNALRAALTRLDHLERERDAFKAQNTELILEAKIAKGFAGNCQSQMARAEAVARIWKRRAYEYASTLTGERPERWPDPSDQEIDAEAASSSAAGGGAGPQTGEKT